MALLITLFFREPDQATRVMNRSEPVPSFREVLERLRRVAAVPGTAWVVLFICTYKLGESLADAMFKPFLVDAGYTAGQIGLWVGTWGLFFSIAGSIAGGVAASRIGILPALAGACVLRALAVGGEWWLAAMGPTPEAVIAVTCAEQLFGGAVTTALFAFMMSQVDRRIGATHYTLLATLEVSGKLVAYQLSGHLAERLGYAGLFGLATVLAVAFLVLLVPIARLLGKDERS